ncbi:MAG: hypothetical protein EB078_05565 [Proteobacteria bacterium]|nr:hypothetical protein [Pseudomonadota bacterium]
MFFSLYFVITALVEGKRTKAKPRMGISPGDVRGSLNIWVTWDPGQFNVQVYRLLFKFASPYSVQKEGIFTVTFDKPLTESFIQIVKVPERFLNLIEHSKEKFLLTVEFKTIEELTMAKTITSKTLKSIYKGTGSQPEISNKLPLIEEDKAVVLTLDYSELQVRRKKLKDLEAQAQAKAKAKPAAAPAAAPTATAAAPKAASEAAAPAPKPETPVKSVRDLVAATNAAKAPVEKP